MSSLDEKGVSANSKLDQRLQMLIIGRLLVIFLLLVTTWVWYSSGNDLTLADLPGGPFLVLIVGVGLTLIYIFLLRVRRNVSKQIRTQFLFDGLLITWLVWRTGDLTSPYITLYIVLISVSSLFLRPRPTLVISGICSLLFVLMAVLASLSVIEPSGGPHTPGRVVQILSFNVVAFLIVGILASRLSDRLSSGEELKETARTLADLRALHERIIESIRSGLVTTDLDGTIYTFNAAASEITGRAADEMQGRSIFSLFGDIQQSIDISRAAPESEQRPRFEADLTTPDGFAVRIGYNVAPLYSESREETGLIITFQDLTQIRSMEESARRKDRLAAVGRVGAGLAHEIRNPLGAMRGAIQVLQSNTPPESVQADLMDIILRESDRLSNIITNFLSYARPKVGDFVESDVCEAIRDTLTLLSHSPDVGGSHKLEQHLPAAPVFVSADMAQLKQVFWNLSRNALQAMPEGGTLTVGLETIPNNRVRIVFEDTGRGMSPDQVERLFEPFSNSTSGGTGLGLSIVYQIIRDHSGTINIRSLEGEGSVITIELPRENRPRSDGSEPGNGSLEPTRLEGLLNVKKEEIEISS
jgi:two-component system sensor histidine kinase PilS (NtrC family)